MSPLEMLFVEVILVAVAVAALASFANAYRREARKEATLRSRASAAGSVYGIGGPPGFAGGADASPVMPKSPLGIRWIRDWGPVDAPTLVVYLVDPHAITPDDYDIADALEELVGEYSGRLRVAIRPQGHPEVAALEVKPAAVMIQASGGGGVGAFGGRRAEQGDRPERRSVLFESGPGSGTWGAEDLKAKIRESIGTP